MPPSYPRRPGPVPAKHPMTQANAEVQVALLDHYLKLSSLFSIRGEVETLTQVARQCGNPACKKCKEACQTADQFEVLEETLNGLKLSPSERCSRGRHKAARMPLLNPLMTFNSIDYIRERKPDELRRMTQRFNAQYQGSTSLQEVAQAAGCFGNFSTHTGRTLKAYISAYKTNGHSHFNRFSRHLKKQGLSNSADNEMLLYLSHPVLRYDARQRYLEGKPIPLLELDLLKVWASRHHIPMPAEVPSFISPDEGEVDADGKINEARNDGARLTRQQVIDQCKMLLPDVLDFLRDLKADTQPEDRDYSHLLSGIMALFAVASLHDDPAIMALPETFSPCLTLALRRMAGSKKASSITESFEVAGHFPLGYINDGFYPSSSAMADAMVANAGDWKKADTALPGATFTQSLTEKGQLQAISRHAIPLTAAATRLPFVQRADGDEPAVTIEDMKAHARALTDALGSWEAGAHLGIYQRQRFHVLADSHLHLLEKPAHKESTSLSLAQVFFTDVLPTSGEYGSHEIDLVAVLRLVLEKYVVTPSNKETLATQVFPVINAMEDHLAAMRRGLFFDNEEVPAGREALMLPADLAASLTTPLPGIRGDMLGKVAYHARWVGMQCRYVHIGAMFLSTVLYQEAQGKQEAVTEAAANIRPSSDTQGNAFQAIEQQMAALDEARDDYRQWAEGALSELMPYIDTLNDFLAVPLASVPLADADADGDATDQGASAAPADDVTPTITAEEIASLKENLSSTLREKDQVTKHVAEIESEMAEQAATIADYKERAAYLENQNQALTHHLNEASDSAKGEPSAAPTTGREDIALHLIEFSKTPTPTAALTLAANLYPDRLVALDSAFDSAAQASPQAGANILRRLMLLATEGVRVMREGNPLYTLNNVLPGDVACSESDTSLNIPKLRQERTFREVLPSGEEKTWLMTAHNWINYDHRLYFEYDQDREAFVIGHAGRHLPVMSQ